MSFLSRIFQKEVPPDPTDIVFGRFSDAFKEEDRYDAWDRSMVLFEKERYVESYQEFLNYLKNSKSNNLFYEMTGNKMKFELFQGSKKIVGYCDGKILKAEAKIAKATTLNVAFMRRLLEQNFTLQYTRYAIQGDDTITMVFHTSVIDASPYKLYYGLKELALHVDKQDDLLISEFNELKPIETGHIKYISREEAKVKYDYYIKSIEKTLKQVGESQLNLNQYPGAESYLYLDLIYRLDYLLKPEGKIMQWIESVHKIYFSKQATVVEERNREINKIVNQMSEISYEDFEKEFYTVISTFGVTAPSNHTKLSDTITSELSSMDWYYENGYDDIALAILSYIAGYNLFSSAMPLPCRDLIHLLYNVLNKDLFIGLGYHKEYRKDGKLNIVNIRKEVKSIIIKHKEEYPKLSISSADIHVADDCMFARSILSIITSIDCTPKSRNH